MKYYSVVTFSLFLISPLFSLPLILYGVYHRYKSSILFFALFVGLMGYLTPPVSDLYRHTIDYYSYEFLSWKAFRGTLERDFVTQTLSYVFAKILFHTILFVSYILQFSFMFRYGCFIRFQTQMCTKEEKEICFYVF